MKNIIPFILIGFGLLLPGCDTAGGGFHERHATEVENSAKVAAADGGQSFDVSKSYDATFEAVVIYLQKLNYTLESVNKDSGQISTAMTITGGWRQTGTRVQVTLIKIGDATTTVKVAVTEQHRFNALQVEPWGDPSVNIASSASLVTIMKTAL